MSKATKNLKESRVSVDSKTAAKVRRIAESSRASLSDIILFFAKGVIHHSSTATDSATLKTRHAV